MPPELRTRYRYVEARTPAPSILKSPDLSDIPKGEPIAMDRKPPVYTIDLSLPPSQRYAHVAQAFKSTVGELPKLFDEVLGIIKPSIIPNFVLHFLAWIFLRRLFSEEQTEELRGLSELLGLPMYLLVAYNVFLDLLMGCTSGGVLVRNHGSAKPHMMHFRTLDWGMPALRKILVQYNFVEKSKGELIASTIGYVGFVGVLTGVKPGLSVSLNFRPYHDDTGWTTGNLCYYWHLLLVLLGFRPSIAARLRDFLLPTTLLIEQEKGPRKDSAISFQLSAQPLFQPSDIPNVREMTTTAAYLIFCTGAETIIFEKDLYTAKTLRSSAFLTVTNHDRPYELSADTRAEHAAHTKTKQPFLGIGMQDLIDESIYRKACLVKKWEAHLSRQRRRNVGHDVNPDARRRGEDSTSGVRFQDLKRWMLKYPICNEETHFVCIMDPVEGVVKWVRCFEEDDIKAGSQSL
ncbi:Nn.00g079950.m01.CDS01 [Neocucurbitaria sp. VM-36]